MDLPANTSLKKQNLISISLPWGAGTAMQVFLCADDTSFLPNAGMYFSEMLRKGAQNEPMDTVGVCATWRGFFHLTHS